MIERLLLVLALPVALATACDSRTDGSGPGGAGGTGGEAGSAGTGTTGGSGGAMCDLPGTGGSSCVAQVSTIGSTSSNGEAFDRSSGISLGCGRGIAGITRLPGPQVVDLFGT